MREASTLHHRFNVTNIYSFANRFARRSLDSVRAEVPDLARLIQKCWAQDPKDRPSFGEIMMDLSDIIGDESAPSSRRSSDFRLTGD